MSDTIFLKGIEALGRHGCSEQERQREQKFLVDVELYLDLTRAAKTDDLGDTIDYVQVISDIKKIVGGASRNLIETVAQDICDFLLKKYLLLDGVTLTLYKPNPPVKDKFGGAAVQIFRDHSQR